MKNNCGKDRGPASKGFFSFVEAYDKVKNLFVLGLGEDEISRVTRIEKKEVKRYKDIWLNSSIKTDSRK